MSFSNYLENKIIDHLLKVASFTVPSNLYIGLSTADPGDSGGTLAEPVGNNYARVLCNSWDTASGGASSNSALVTFPTATGNWGTITYACIFDAISGGNLLISGQLTINKTVTSGDTIQFAIGDLDVSLD